MSLTLLAAIAPCATTAPASRAADQLRMGAGNDDAERVAAGSPRVRAAHDFLVAEARKIKDRALRTATLDLLQNPNFCVTSRRGVDAGAERRLLDELEAAELLDPADDAAFPGGLVAGVFPALRDPDSDCPRLALRFDAAPGSGFSSHHGYPGGLPIHEANNLRAALGLAQGYRASYRATIDQDVILAAPIWHDWAKALVFQWTAAGEEFQEINLGGNPANGSATGAHHIVSLAETLKRGLSPVFVIAQASAHASPTLGNEFKVVNWIRAAAILAQIDPVAGGYLTRDAGGYHMPALRRLADGPAGAAFAQSPVLPEYTLHAVSDADFVFSIPAALAANRLLAALGPRYGFDPADSARYNTRFRNPVLAHIGAERLYILYANGGVTAVKKEVDAVRTR